MADAVAQLTKELQAVRKGRGLDVAQLAERLGPALRAVCEVNDDLGEPEIRARVASRLGALAEELPDDLRLAALVALGMHPDVRRPFYQNRVHWLAAQMQRDDRTAKRRIDQAIEQLAQLAIARPRADQTEFPASDWYTKELRVALVLDGDSPDAVVCRHIVAERDGLAQIDLAVTLTNPREQPAPRTADDLRVQVIFGGTLDCVSKESSDRFGLVLNVSDPLARNQSHIFALRTVVPPGRPMLPHYVCVPNGRCDMFELRVRFGRAHPPRLVRRLDDVFQRDIDDPAITGAPLTLDNAGEICVTFHHLKPSRAYGARWET